MSAPAMNSRATSSRTADLQAVLAGEHAAVYAHGVVGARLRGAEEAAALVALATHRARRDRLQALVAAGGAVPVAAQPAYPLPFPVPDRTAALLLAALVEDRLAALYVALVAADADRALRSWAAATLQRVAADATRWRLAGRLPRPTVAFPGR